MKTLAALASAFLLVAGCAAQTDSVGSSDDGSQTDDISASSRTYVALRKDVRKCASPMCGGYFVHDVNRVALNEVYVSGLDFTGSGLTAGSIDDVTTAPAGELVLHGKLGAISASTGTRKFVVSEAWRGMPGRVVGATDAFYFTSERNPPIQCFTAPCNNDLATKLNFTPTTSFTNLDVSAALPSYGDEAWLTAQALEHGAVVAGTFAQGAQYPGGPESNLEASQVFVKLPEQLDSCPPQPQIACGPGTVRTVTRDENRCLNFAGCVKPGFCPQFLPACDAGYTRASWRGGVNACNVYACDPTFIVQ